MKFLRSKLKLREYQQKIFETACKNNTLVVVPTGLGKTIIAVSLAGERTNLGKVLFLAPTKPLIQQHFNTFSDYFEANEKEMIVFSGEVPAILRKKQWVDAKIIFSTPQTIQNDLQNNNFDLSAVSLLVIDEAHRSVGDYAYVFVCKKYIEDNENGKILGLTASPSSSRVKLKKISESLNIDAIELRSRASEDVVDYVMPVKINYDFTTLTPEIENMRGLIKRALDQRINWLQAKNIIKTKKVSKKLIIALQKSMSKNIAKNDYFKMQIVSKLAFLIKLMHAQSLLEAESLYAFKTYMSSIEQQAISGKTKAAKEIFNDFNVKTAFEISKSLLEKNKEHPKIKSLKKIVASQLNAKKESKILVFTEYRDNILAISSELKELDGLSFEKFVGQASKAEKGMSQKEQMQVLDKFRSNELQLLIATSVAEEGLDIPSVDLVVFYSPVASEIRSIQRKGRTGRQEAGKIVIMITKDTKDEAYYWSAHHKESQMKHLITNKSIFGKGLGGF